MTRSFSSFRHCKKSNGLMEGHLGGVRPSAICSSSLIQRLISSHSTMQLDSILMMSMGQDCRAEMVGASTQTSEMKCKRIIPRNARSPVVFCALESDVGRHDNQMVHK